MLAIDDFGADYSSLRYLKRLPLIALKIDQSFVRDLVNDSDDRILAATIITLGHGLGLKVVAEGVETDQQRQILLHQGCNLAQGYFFGRPALVEAESHRFCVNSKLFHQRYRFHLHPHLLSNSDVESRRRPFGQSRNQS